jgi:hypothetical protein
MATDPLQFEYLERFFDAQQQRVHLALRRSGRRIRQARKESAMETAGTLLRDCIETAPHATGPKKPTLSQRDGEWQD